MSALVDAQRGGTDIPTLYIESEASARNSIIINQLLLSNSSLESSNRKGSVCSFPFQFILLHVGFLFYTSKICLWSTATHTQFVAMK